MDMDQLERNELQVYFHYCFQTEEVFYVGMGIKRRPWDKGKSRGKFWNDYVNKHGNYEVQIIHSNLNISDAITLEIQYIKFFGRRNLKTGSLVNFTDGGEGMLGYKHPESFKKMLREIPRTEEWKKRISESNKGRINSPESISKMKQTMSKVMSGFGNPRTAYYKVVSPEGRVYELHNGIDNFIIEYKDAYDLKSGFIGVCSETRKEWKGWRLIDKVDKKGSR